MSIHFSRAGVQTFIRAMLAQLEHEEKEMPNRAFKQILKRAMDLGISDLSMQHDHYLYGTDKR